MLEVIRFQLPEVAEIYDQSCDHRKAFKGVMSRILVLFEKLKGAFASVEFQKIMI